MRQIKWYILLYVLFDSFHTCFSDVRPLEIIPERAKITYENKKYIHNTTINVRRYKRRGPYVVNLWGIIHHTWANNVTIDAIFYEYLHNEFKRSFIEMHFKLCDLINEDILIGAAIRAKGKKCPLFVGYNDLTNVTMLAPEFPYVVPFEKGKVDVFFRTEPSHDLIASGYLVITMKQLPLFKSNKG